MLTSEQANQLFNRMGQGDNLTSPIQNHPDRGHDFDVTNIKFKNRKRSTEHFNKHKEEFVDFGVTNQTQYLNMARNFLNSPVVADVFAHVTSHRDPRFYKFSSATGEFASVDQKTGVLKTYFIASDDPVEFWNRRLRDKDD